MRAIISETELLGDSISDGQVYRAVRYCSADGKIDDYFTPDGRSVRRHRPALAL